MKYEVELEGTRTMTHGYRAEIIVEADSEEQAETKAREEVAADDTLWHENFSDYTDTEVENIEVAEISELGSDKDDE